MVSVVVTGLCTPLHTFRPPLVPRSFISRRRKPNTARPTCASTCLHPRSKPFSQPFSQPVFLSRVSQTTAQQCPQAHPQKVFHLHIAQGINVSHTQPAVNSRRAIIFMLFRLLELHRLGSRKYAARSSVELPSVHCKCAAP